MVALCRAVHLHPVAHDTQESKMALSVRQPQQENSSEGLPSSWRCNNNSVKKKRHSSAPPPQRTTASTTAFAEAQASPSHNVVNRSHRNHHHEHHEPPTAPQHSDSAAATTPAAVATSAPSNGDSSGPLSFPKPKFSAALKVVEDGGFTLVSRATGRRWMAVNSSRECQFGEVLRVVELTEDAAAPLAYFAVKVHSYSSVCSRI